MHFVQLDVQLALPEALSINKELPSINEEL
jgi:hypothetical protein